MADYASDRFAAFLARALQLLAHDTPEHLARVRAQLHGLAVQITIGEHTPLRVQLDVAPWIGPAAHAEVQVALSEHDLIAVLAGQLTIERALELDRLLLRGELPHLDQFFTALDTWLHGAVRSQSMPALFDEYLATSPSPQPTR